MQMNNPPHPGKFLKQCYLEELNLTVTKTAEMLGISRVSLSEIINCKSRITAEMAIKLSKAFSTSPEFWANMQSSYDLWQAIQKVNVDDVQVIYSGLKTETEKKKSA